MAAIIDRQKVKKANPNAKRVGADAAVDIAMERYPVIIARLAK